MEHIIYYSICRPFINLQTSPRKLVGQKSEGESQRTASECQGFIADFSQFSIKPEVTESEAIEGVPSQQFTGVCGAFHIYRKPSPSKSIHSKRHFINIWIDFNLGLVLSEREISQEEAVKDEAESISKLTLQELREKNAELRQVCEELTKELAIALQERINLRAKLLLLT